MSLGQASILANLHHHKIPVIAKAWAVNQPSFDYKDVHAFVIENADENTDVALGAYVWHEPQTQMLLNDLKQDNFSGRIILGGPQISYTKNKIEQFYPQADIFIRGYGEEALAQLMLSPERKPAIDGVHYAGESDSGISAKMEIELLPSPFLTGIIPAQAFIRWETQRGCPFRCSFCQHRESDISMKRRQFSDSRIMEEIRWIIENPVIRDIAVLDPVFNSGPHYLKTLEALIQGKYRGKLALQCRAEMIQDEFLNRIEELNKTAHVVLEIGLQTTNKEEQKLIQRPNNMNKITHVFSEIHKRNIATEVSLIFGLPNQTVQSFETSIQFCKDAGIPTIYAFPLMLLRGTPLYENKKQLGLVETSDINIAVDRMQQNIPHVISSPSFTVDDWHIMARMAESLDVYNKSSTPKMLNTLQHTFWQNSAIKEIDRSTSDDDHATTYQNKSVFE